MFALSLAVGLAALAVSFVLLREARSEDDKADLPPHHPSLPSLGDPRRTE